MRRVLLDAVLEVYPTGRNGAPVVIDDVIRHAKVARGTFYKYFVSLDQAVSELGAELAVDMIEAMEPLSKDIVDPVERAAMGIQCYLLRARIDPRWGLFVTHIGLLTGDNPLVHGVRVDIQRGVDSGDYAIPSVLVATDLLLGTKIEAIRRILTGEVGLDYIHAITAMVLHSLGVAPARADAAIRSTHAMMDDRGPDLINWWPAQTTPTQS